MDGCLDGRTNGWMDGLKEGRSNRMQLNSVKKDIGAKHGCLSRQSRS